MLIKSRNITGTITDKNMRLNIIVNIIITIVIFALLYIIGINIWNNINEYNIEKLIYYYGILGIMVYLYILISWKKIFNRIYTPYILFITFIFIFNYGQFLMWGLGIHYEGELGTTNFIRFMDSITLLKIEIVALLGIVGFHLGGSISNLLTMNNIMKSRGVINIDDKKGYCYSMKFVSSCILIIATPVVLYSNINGLKIALEHGYSAIYYGDYTNISPIIKYISYMFYPALFGYLIGHKFSKKSFRVVNIIFGTNMIINLLAGDRGSWIYFLLIYFWCYKTYYRELRINDIIKIIVGGVSLLIITSILVKFREIGFQDITMEDIQVIIRDLPFIFIKPFFEMGQSARVLGIIIQDNLNESWQFGCTYFSAILAMILPRVKIFFGYPDFYLDNWISQSYLMLNNYGVGFSITAEAYLNGGLYMSPIIMVICGFIIAVMIRTDSTNSQNPISIFIVLSSATILMGIARGSVELFLRQWFYGSIVLVFLFMIVKRCVKALY